MIRDEQIIELVLKGNVDQYAELIRRHQDWLFRMVYRITGRREDAEDAIQEAFVIAYNKLADCRDRRKFGPWVRRIAVNVCLRHFSRELPVDEIVQSGDPYSAEDSVEQEVLRRAQAEEIREAVGRLSPVYRVVLILRYEEDMEMKEIAELLGEQPGTVYTRLHRAKKLLAKQLEVTFSEMR